MNKRLIDKAIACSLAGHWSEAVKHNKAILTDAPDDIPTLNRLAKALTVLGECSQAKAVYERVLVLDRFNPIATRNISQLSHHQTGANPCSPSINLNFVEEPGKTKEFPLIRLGDPKILNTLEPGQIVHLVKKNHVVSVVNDQHEYIGALTDDISFNLKKKLDCGNEYQATIRSARDKKVSLFIRETHRALGLTGTPSFS